MKILLAYFWALPHVGGANTYIQMMTKILEEHGHHVDILARHPDGGGVYLANTGERIGGLKLWETACEEARHHFQSHFPQVDSWIFERETERCIFELALSYLNLHQYDILHAQDQLSTRALWSVKPDSVPLVASIHSSLADEHQLKGRISSADSLAGKYAEQEEYLGSWTSSRTIVASDWLKRQLLPHYPQSEDQFRVIPYGIDLASFQERLLEEPDPPLPDTEDRFVIACPARLVHVKGHRTLIEALSRVKGRRDHFVCWLIGDGYLREELEQYCMQMNVADCFFFLGNRTDVPAVLKKADLVVLPSLSDNQPFAVIEAQAAGKAIVASNAGGIPEMIADAETGLLFERGDAVQLADKIMEAMDDPSLRRMLEVNAGAWARKQWAFHTLYGQTMSIYREAIEAGRQLKQPKAQEPSLVFFSPDSAFMKKILQTFKKGGGA
ncbi:glycosyltransferase family 4 protein [Paenibacillus doosanensis]|uniref:glycosyltransferase family 4 protein n=1 Tax=Paenibacillus doosanensis TaxID=1229154 RepID=UPI00218042D7|nr:glycosyltransferase family 4 protein [Paenibacillus doosanensis]MCS7458802.1 glycosyltransferase family 4 protein [Paenibacillus doosanensis]